MSITIVIKGLESMSAKATAETVEGPTRQAIAAIGEELATSKGTGMGVRVNSLALQVQGMAAAIDTSLVWPRTSGGAWEAHTIEDFEAIAAEILPQAGALIEQAWG